MILASNYSETIDELKAAIRARGTGGFALLSLCDEFFQSATDEEKQLLVQVSTEFCSIVHDLRNIATISRRMETLVSVPDIGANELNSFLAADIDLFFSYVQSIFDYLAEALILIFPSPNVRNRCNFGILSNWYRDHEQRTTDPVIIRLRDRIVNAQWILETRTLRNDMTHGTALPYVTIPLHSQEILFQILQGERPCLTTVNLDQNFFSKEIPTYVRFKPFAGTIFGKLIAFLNDVSELFILSLSQRVAATGRLNHTTVTLNNMSLPLHWAQLGITCLNSAEPVLSPNLTPQKQEVLRFIESKLIDGKDAIQRHSNIAGLIIEIAGLIDILTNREMTTVLPSQRDPSVYSFRTVCVRRKFKDNPKRQLAELLEILAWLRADIASGRQNSLGQVHYNWTDDHLQMLISPFPAILK